MEVVGVDLTFDSGLGRAWYQITLTKLFLPPIAVGNSDV